VVGVTADEDAEFDATDQRFARWEATAFGAVLGIALCALLWWVLG
jgi:hypothetical protein